MRTASLLAAVLCGASLAAAAQAPATPASSLPPSHPPIGGMKAKAAPSPWSAFADYTLTLRVPGGQSGSWTFHTYAAPGDLRLEFDTPRGSGREKGSLLLAGGNALATRGYAPEPGFELDPLDAAVLQFKVLTALLDAALPGGPASLKGSQAVSAGDKDEALVVSTPTANAGFIAPWSLKGKVERVDASSVAFELTVEAPTGSKPGATGRWTYSGRAAGAQKDRTLADSTSLAGWTAYVLGPGTSSKEKAHATLRFRATKVAGGVATVKDLRAAK